MGALSCRPATLRSVPATPDTDIRYLPAMAFVAPFAAFVLLMMAEPLLEPLVAPVFDPRWLYAVRCGLALAALVAFRRHYLPLRPESPGGAGRWLAAVGVGIGVFALWIALDLPLLVTGEADPYDASRGAGLAVGVVAVRWAGSALVVPVIEELFWRGFIMRWVHHPRFEGVDPRDVSWKALVVSSAVFALEHRLWFAGLLAGLAYGELYRRTGDLRLAVLAHAVTNALLGAWVVGTGAWGFW